MARRRGTGQVIPHVGEYRLKIKLGYSFAGAASYYGAGYVLDLVPRAENAGFDSLWLVDHFLPFYHTDAHTPQAWILMAMALERARKLPMGTEVTVPMYKYHPLIIAHAFATMANIYPGRVIFGVGSGEAVNEVPFLGRWPKWGERAETLLEALSLIRKYWSSEDYFDFEGRHYRVKRVMCYDRPKEPIPILISAMGPKMAALVGKNGYGILTTDPPERSREIIYPAFEEAAFSSGHNTAHMEKAMVVGIGYGNPEELARKYQPVSGQMAFNDIVSENDPKKIEALGRNVDLKLIMKSNCFSNRSSDFIDLIERSKNAGAQHVILEDWSIDHLETIKVLEDEVLPHFHS